VNAILASFVVALTLAAPTDDGARTAPTMRIDRELGAVRELELEVGQNRLLMLSEAIARVAVADPAVADLKVITPNQVLLTSKGAGTTDLTLWNKDNVPLVIALQVKRNVEALRRQLKELFPKENVTASAAGDLVVLVGEVNDLRTPERVAQVARLHGKQVANLITVGGDHQVQLSVRFAEVSRSGLKQIGVNLFERGFRTARTDSRGRFRLEIPAGEALFHVGPDLERGLAQAPDRLIEVRGPAADLRFDLEGKKVLARPDHRQMPRTLQVRR